MKISRNYAALKENYLFLDIAERIAAYKQAHPEADIIRMGIGDVTLPLCAAVVEALRDAAADMGNAETFHGYGPERGYDFLREAIRDYYKEKRVHLEAEELFISDGAKSDAGNILDLFDTDNRVLVPNPVYPAYVDANLMAGRPIHYINANAGNGFLPMPDEAQPADIIYLCSPNNPTGAVYNRNQLREWVDYARRKGALILFDAAYEAFVRDKTLPRSIFEIPGSRECAIEICSFSKFAGFTGTRCGYTAIPKELSFGGMSINKMWLRRQSTKFNGVSYVVQRGAAAVFSPEGRRQCAANIDYYMENAAVIADALNRLGIPFIGGRNAPYIWLACPGGMSSWDFFTFLLQGPNIAGTPGAGFGENGKDYFRLSTFGSRERTEEAMERITAAITAGRIPKHDRKGGIYP